MMEKLLRTCLAACLCVAPSCLGDCLPSYVTRVWQTADGLPRSTVTAVIQSRDGYIWLGTRSGLARFDGARFTLFDGSNTPEMQSPHVTCLFEDGEGTLWIGHETGDVTCRRAGKFYSVPIRAAWRGGKIFSIAADRAGDIWVTDEAGELVRLRDGLMIPSPDRAVHLLAMAGNSSNGPWLRRDSEISLLQAGQLKPLDLDGSPTNRYIQGIAPSRDGGLWVMTESHMQKWKDGRWVQDLGTAPWGWGVAHVLIETRDGNLVAATSDHGLFIISPTDGSSRQFARATGFTDDWITSLCEDREGNLWAGTGNGGLALLRIGNLTTLSPPDQWQGRAVLGVTAGPDAFWVGTEGAGLYCFRSGGWTNFGKDRGLEPRYIWSVQLDAEGQTWAGTWGSGLFVGNGAQFEIPPGLKELSAPVPALLACPDGSLLIGTRAGLLRYEHGNASWLGCQPELASPDVRAVSQGADGTVWFGMSGGGLGCYQGGKLRQWRRSEGLSSDYVQCLHLEADRTLWIGTIRGLNRFKAGRFVAITRVQGLANDIICAIEDDGLGYFWMSTHGGILRVNRAELDQCADGAVERLHCLNYGLSDGLPSLQCSGGFQPASCKTPDGRLLFPTSKGLVAVDPRQVTTNSLAPPVVIESFLVDDRPVAESPEAEGPLTIQPGSHRYEFQFTALSFAAPEKVRFEYRLEGSDPNWVETQSPRKAYYSHLPPGAYSFQVRACNNDGVWNEQGAALAFSVLPAFWQTWWFRGLGAALVAAAGGGIVWLDSRRRLRQRLERMERLQAIERERARIAKDIHDDLGAGLTRISLLSELVPIEEVNPPQAAEALNRIFTTTHEMTQTMDEIVWAVNPRHDTLDSLATYLGKFAQDFLESTGVRCRLEMPIQLPSWRVEAEVRHNLFLAFKESLNNVLRHAGATEVRISLTITEPGFTIVVEDNGKGFAYNAPPASALSAGQSVGRNGLANMRYRLAQIAGRCQISSIIGQGTRVELFAALKA